MHRKGVQDAKRARVWAKRAAMSAARQANMTKDTIDRAVKKAAGAAAGDDYVEVRYEGYGPAGVAVIVEALTDNRNRTASDIRTAFNKHGGALGETNSVSFLFNRMGVIRYPLSVASADDMLEAAIEAGAEDAVTDAEGHEVTCRVEDFFAARDALESRFGAPEAARLDWRPTTQVTLDQERAASLLKLLDVLDESDDVQNVYANFDIPEEVMQALSA
jgi:YebC/PmpR family DNA-binding regulatory protein